MGGLEKRETPAARPLTPPLARPPRACCPPIKAWDLVPTGRPRSNRAGTKIMQSFYLGLVRKSTLSEHLQAACRPTESLS